MRFVKYICLLGLVFLTACFGGNHLQRMSEDKVAKQRFFIVWF